MSDNSENVEDRAEELAVEHVEELAVEHVEERAEELVEERAEELAVELVEERAEELAVEHVEERAEELAVEHVEERAEELVEERAEELAVEHVEERGQEQVNSLEENIKVEITETDAPLTETAIETNNVSMPNFETEIIPKYVFIIPYRDREQQLAFFKKHMSFVLEDTDPKNYKTFFIHQCDARSFNRGAMKNIGFLYVKNKYPNDYQNITLVFNDIDTMPYTKNFFDYDTTPGNVKHFYGFKFTLGGIVSIKAGDFEMINGYPNFWAWGYEDNLLQKRALNSGLFIDRSQFYPLMDKNIFQMKDGLERLVNRTEFDKFLGLTVEGISDIKNLTYEFDSDTNFVNVKSFFTGTEDLQNQSTSYDLTKGSRPFVAPTISGRRRAGMKMSFN